MYSYIKGKVAARDGDKLIVENNGIGYELSVSYCTLSNVKIGADILIYTYLQVKQDGIALLGFLSAEEKSMFSRLITVGGVGPKSALAILGEIAPYDLAFAVAGGDSLKLSKVKGIGKKTAARIVLELREKIDLEERPADGASQGAVGADKTASSGNKDIDDVVVALLTLGFSSRQAYAAAENAAASGANGVEDILRDALKNIR
ncbi:MAG: Holliday junction branch migration protein RuvA [Clostridiales bacterium]|jgi:Holliday junction DNA helicase RuvA|nr:Holliday junction branch migration protein RuvA [Clostridiales bacterium]